MNRGAFVDSVRPRTAGQAPTRALRPRVAGAGARPSPYRRLGCWFVVWVAALGSSAVPGRALGQGDGTPDPSHASTPQATAALEDFDQRLGPFDLQGRPFTVVLHMKRVAGAARSVEADFRETVAAMAIEDSAGAIHYRKTFPYEVAGDRFAETTAVSAQLLEGTQGRGLLVTYATLPSAPLSGASWQVFGLFAGPRGAPANGKLVAFGKPVVAEGQLLDEKPEQELLRTSEEPGLQGDVLRVRVWTGNVFVIVPLRILWAQNTVRLAWRCVKMTRSGPRPLCELKVEAQRVPAGDEMTFVRLHPDTDEDAGIATHVVVTKDSKVAFLAAETEVVWKEDTDSVGLGVSEDVWLKVRIDGKAGWIHTQEDFHAIGLPQAG